MKALIIMAVVSAVPAGCFLLGYHIGRNHERQGWKIWLESKRS